MTEYRQVSIDTLAEMVAEIGDLRDEVDRLKGAIVTQLEAALRASHRVALEETARESVGRSS